jgi:hypothetical protein
MSYDNATRTKSGRKNISYRYVIGPIYDKTTSTKSGHGKYKLCIVLKVLDVIFIHGARNIMILEITKIHFHTIGSFS